MSPIPNPPPIPKVIIIIKTPNMISILPNLIFLEEVSLRGSPSETFLDIKTNGIPNNGVRKKESELPHQKPILCLIAKKPLTIHIEKYTAYVNKKISCVLIVYLLKLNYLYLMFYKYDIRTHIAKISHSKKSKESS